MPFSEAKAHGKILYSSACPLQEPTLPLVMQIFRRVVVRGIDGATKSVPRHRWDSARHKQQARIHPEADALLVQ